MTTPITLLPLDEQTLGDLRRRYDETSNAETRTRYQMLVLALSGQTTSQIAQMVLRSQDTVERVLKRFQAGRMRGGASAYCPRPKADDHRSLGKRAAAGD